MILNFKAITPSVKNINMKKWYKIIVRHMIVPSKNEILVPIIA